MLRIQYIYRMILGRGIQLNSKVFSILLYFELQFFSGDNYSKTYSSYASYDT